MIARVLRRFKSGMWWKIHCAGRDECMDAKTEYRLRVSDNITTPKGSGSTLFM